MKINTVEDISELVLDLFIKAKSRSGESIMLRSIRNSFIVSLNPNELNLLPLSINYLIDAGYVIHEKTAPECLVLTDTGFHHISNLGI